MSLLLAILFAAAFVSEWSDNDLGRDEYTPKSPTRLVVGDCVAPKWRPEGWPVAYRVVSVEENHYKVETLIVGEEIKPDAPWYREKVGFGNKELERMDCPQ
jgi:hypothetical protein